MRHASNEVVPVHSRCLEDCRFTIVFAQKHWGCATPQANWIKIDTSNGSLKVQIYDIIRAFFFFDLKKYIFDFILVKF